MTYTASKDLLKGKVILITGAGRGIGRAAAIAFASHGAQVLLVGRTMRHLNEVYDEIVEMPSCPQPAIFPLDLTMANPDHYKSLSITLRKEFQRLDGILHNAAMLADLAPFQHLNIQQWFSTMQTNVNAPFMLTQALLPLLQESESASLIFTLSDRIENPKAYWGANAVSKHALVGMMELLAAELDNTTVRANAINPGPVKTTLRAKAYPAEDPDELTLPEEIMSTYLYLMGDDSREVSGDIFHAQKKK